MIREVNARLRIPVPTIVTPEDFFGEELQDAKKRGYREGKGEIRKRVQREFPGCKALQNIHYYRYVKEIECQKISSGENNRSCKNNGKIRTSDSLG